VAFGHDQCSLTDVGNVCPAGKVRLSFLASAVN